MKKSELKAIIRECIEESFLVDEKENVGKDYEWNYDQQRKHAADVAHREYWKHNAEYNKLAKMRKKEKQRKNSKPNKD